MKLAFRFPRRWHPYRYRAGQMMPPNVMREIFDWAAAAGFSGCELSTAHQDFPGYSQAQLDAVCGLLDSTGLVAAAYNPGGFRWGPDATAGRGRLDALLESVQIAARLKAPVINLTLPGPGAGSGGGLPSEYLVGSRIPLGSGRSRPADEIAALARALAELADAAAAAAISVALEIHQNSYIEDSRTAIELLELINRENVGLNPDLGNILWAQAIPRETSEDAIERLAPYATYVHMKNIRRVFVPGLDRSAFVRTSLLERGDIDWRWAISELRASGYDGFLTFEGDYSEGWDFQQAMQQNASYVQSLLGAG